MGEVVGDTPNEAGRGASGRQDEEGPHLVVVYRGLYGANAQAALRVLIEAGCSPIALDHPLVTWHSPGGFYAGEERVRIAVPPNRLDDARRALTGWQAENDSRLRQFHGELVRWLGKALCLLLLAGVPPAVVATVIALLGRSVKDALGGLISLWLGLFFLAAFTIVIKRKKGERARTVLQVYGALIGQGRIPDGRPMPDRPSRWESGRPTGARSGAAGVLGRLFRPGGLPLGAIVAFFLILIVIFPTDSIPALLAGLLIVLLALRPRTRGTGDTSRGRDGAGQP
ncbi:MAG: hypothetical protein ACOC8E_04400 [Planctomycetota bacterium]